MKPMDEITFIVLCIQRLALYLEISQEEVYTRFNAKKIIENFILPCFSALKTQSWLIVQNELVALMQN